MGDFIKKQSFWIRTRRLSEWQIYGLDQNSDYEQENPKDKVVCANQKGLSLSGWRKKPAFLHYRVGIRSNRSDFLWS